MGGSAELYFEAILATWWGQRTFRAVRRESAFRERYPASPDGIVIGAESREYPVGGDGPVFDTPSTRGDRAILLLHGYNDAPTALDGIARRLQRVGWTVSVPLLPGHGRSLEAFCLWSAEEALTASRAAYAELRARFRTVAVGGISMGGALACCVAAESAARGEEPSGLVLYSPMLVMPPAARRAHRTSWLWSPFTKYGDGGGGRSIHDEGARAQQIAYRCSSRGSLKALAGVAAAVERALPGVRTPTLVFHSEEDNRIPAPVARAALERLRPAEREVVWVRGAGHVITVDYGWEGIADRTVEWLAARFQTA
jgi:carboxylesterase